MGRQLSRVLRGTLSVLVALVVGSCAETPSRGTDAVKTTAPSHRLSLAFAYQRVLSLAPCGCSMRPLGGVVREATLLEQWRAGGGGSVVSLTAGVTFVPHAIEFDGKKLSVYRDQSRRLVQAMNRIGVSTLFPQAEDALIGISELRSLSREAKFPFVSTNLYDASGKKPIFATYHEVRTVSPPALFLGIAAPVEGYPTPDDVTVRSPEEALTSVFARLPAEERFVVVVTSLGRDRQLELQKKFPQINLWLGGPDGRASRRRDQLTPTALTAAVMDLGREILRFDIDLVKPLSRFYSASNDFVYGNQKRHYEAEARKWRRALKRAKSRKDREKYAALVKARETDIRELEQRVPLTPTDDASRYDFRSVELDARYDSTAKSELTELVSAANEAASHLK